MSDKATKPLPSNNPSTQSESDPELAHEATARDDPSAHKGSAGVSNTVGRGSAVMSKEQKEGKDPIGRHVAEELESHTDEGERVRRVDKGSV